MYIENVDDSKCDCCPLDSIVQNAGYYYRLSMNIPTISIIRPMHAANEMIIVRAVAETQTKNCKERQ